MFEVPGFVTVYGSYKEPESTLDTLYVKKSLKNKTLTPREHADYLFRVGDKIVKCFMASINDWKEGKLSIEEIYHLLSRIKDKNVYALLRRFRVDIRISNLGHLERIRVYYNQQPYVFHVKYTDGYIYMCSWEEYLSQHKKNFVPLRIRYEIFGCHIKVNSSVNPNDPFINVSLSSIYAVDAHQKYHTYFPIPLIHQDSTKISMQCFDWIGGKTMYTNVLQFEELGWNYASDTHLPDISREDVVSLVRDIYNGTSELMTHVYERIALDDGLVWIKNKAYRMDMICLNENLDVIAILYNMNTFKEATFETVKINYSETACDKDKNIVKRYMLACNMSETLILP